MLIKQMVSMADLSTDLWHGSGAKYKESLHLRRYAMTTQASPGI